MSEELHISCAARGDYIQHSAAMLHSVLTRGGFDRVRVHYLHRPDLDAHLKQSLEAMIEGLGGSISFLPIDDTAVADLPSSAEFTSAMWYRVYLPELLPRLDKVLYLDVDTLAVDSLRPLWETNLEGNYLAAVTNVFQLNHVHRPASLGLPRTQSYFNSGVLLLNLAEMRRDGCTERVRECAIERGGELEWPDQDALNLVLGSLRVNLHPRWNCMNSLFTFDSSADVFGIEAVEKARTEPGIRHFEGPLANKPWHYMCDQELRDLYLAHRRQTPWPSPRLEGVSTRNKLRRLARLARRRSRFGFRRRTPVNP